MLEVETPKEIERSWKIYWIYQEDYPARIRELAPR
jgi:hypothetical protein